MRDGGGWDGWSLGEVEDGLGDGHAALGKVARVIRSSLDDHFPQSPDAPETDVAIIAEPGRYFSVLKADSAKALSLLTRGRLYEGVMPRS